MTKPERDALNAEFARLYPSMADDKLTTRQKQQLVDAMKRDAARVAEILAY